MILSMNQPCYIPWYGFVERVGMSDVHVIGDDKQFVKTEIQTRNRIRTKDGVRWLTVPVRGHSAGKMIRDVEIADTQWQNKHITNLKVSYKKAPFFQTYGPRYETLLSQGWKYLSDLNVALQKQIVNDFGFKTKMILGSELQVEGSRGEYLFNLCRELDADVYVTTAKAGLVTSDSEAFPVGVYEQVERGAIPVIRKRKWNRTWMTEDWPLVFTNTSEAAAMCQEAIKNYDSYRKLLEECMFKRWGNDLNFGTVMQGVWDDYIISADREFSVDKLKISSS